LDLSSHISTSVPKAVFAPGILLRSHACSLSNACQNIPQPRVAQARSAYLHLGCKQFNKRTQKFVFGNLIGKSDFGFG
jgi:hypothetical protein